MFISFSVTDELHLFFLLLCIQSFCSCFYLLHDSFLVVVAQRSAEFVIIHCRPVLLYPPPTSHLYHTHTQKHTHKQSVNSVLSESKLLSVLDLIS